MGNTFKPAGFRFFMSLPVGVLTSFFTFVLVLLAAPQARAQATVVPLRDYRVQVKATNEQQAQLDFDAVFFGIEAFGKPIVITPDSPLAAQNPKGLIAFIASLVSAFQSFSDPAELESYLLVEDTALRTPTIELRDLVKGLLRQHNGLVRFELYCGWFTAPTDFQAVLKLVESDGKVRYSPALFTFRSGEWKLLMAGPNVQTGFGIAICLALDNPRRFQMRYRKALPDEGAIMPAEGWRSFF